MSKQKSKAPKVFLWQHEVEQKLLSCISCSDSKPLQSAVLFLLREVTPCVDKLISERKFHSGKRLLISLRRLLVYFELRRKEVDKLATSPSLSDLMSALLSIMVDLRIFLSDWSKKPTSKEDTLTQIVLDTLLFTDCEDRHMIWDTLLQSTALREKKNRELCSGILERLILESPWKRLQNPETYLKCLLCMRLWYQNASKEHRLDIMAKASRIPRPKHLSRWLCSSNIEGIPLYDMRAHPKIFVKPFVKNMSQGTADSLCAALSDDIIEDNAQSSSEQDQTVPDDKCSDADQDALFVIDKAGGKNPDDLTSESLLQQIEEDLQNLPEMPAKSKKKVKKKTRESFEVDSCSSKSLKVSGNDLQSEEIVCADSNMASDPVQTVEDTCHGFNEKSRVRKQLEFDGSEKNSTTNNNIVQLSDFNWISRAKPKSPKLMSKSLSTHSDTDSENTSQVERRRVKKFSKKSDKKDAAENDTLQISDSSWISKAKTKLSKSLSTYSETDLQNTTQVERRRVKKSSEKSEKKGAMNNDTLQISDLILNSSAKSKSSKLLSKSLSTVSDTDSDNTFQIERKKIKKASAKNISPKSNFIIETPVIQTQEPDNTCISNQKTSPVKTAPKSPRTEDKFPGNIDFGKKSPLKTLSPKFCTGFKIQEKETLNSDDDDSDSTVENLSISRNSASKGGQTQNENGLSSFLENTDFDRSASKHKSPAKTVNLETHSTPFKMSSLSENSQTFSALPVLDLDVIKNSETLCLGLDQSGILKSPTRDGILNSDKPDLLQETSYFVTDVVTQTDFSGDEDAGLNGSEKVIYPSSQSPNIKKEMLAYEDDHPFGSQKLFSSQESSITPPNLEICLSDEFLSPETTPCTTPENSSSAFSFVNKESNEVSMNFSSVEKSLKKVSPKKSSRSNTPKTSPVKRHNSPKKNISLGQSPMKLTDECNLIDEKCEVKEKELLSSPSLLLEDDDDRFDVDCESLLSVMNSTTFTLKSSEKTRKNQKDAEILDSVLKPSGKASKNASPVKDTVVNTLCTATDIAEIFKVRSGKNKDKTISQDKLFLTPPSTRCNSDRFSPDSVSTVVSKPAVTEWQSKTDEIEEFLPSPVKRKMAIQKMQLYNNELENYMDSLQDPKESPKQDLSNKHTPKTSKERKSYSLFLSPSTENDALTQHGSKRKVKNVKSRKKVTCAVELDKLDSDVASDDADISYVSDSDTNSTDTLPYLTKIHSPITLSSSLEPKKSKLSDDVNKSFEFPKTYSKSRKKSRSISQNFKDSTKGNTSVILETLDQSNEEDDLEMSSRTRAKKMKKQKGNLEDKCEDLEIDGENSCAVLSVHDDLNNNEKFLSQVSQLSPHTQTAVQEQTYMIIDNFLKECRSNLEKKVQLDDTTKCDSQQTSVRRLSQSSSILSNTSETKLTPTSEAAVQTVLQSRHIAMLTPNITRKRQTQTTRKSNKSANTSSLLNQSRVTRSHSKPPSVQKRLKVSPTPSDKKSQKAKQMKTESPKSKRKLQEESSSDLSEIPERMATRSSQQSGGYSFRQRPKTPSNST